MQIQIGASESELTDTVETQIMAHVKALEDYVNGLTGCTRCLQHVRFIVLEKAGRVRIHLGVPGGELAIDKQNSKDLPRAITEAFTAARQKLEVYVHQLRHDVKIQGRAPDVRVTTIFRPDGYGVFETIDGREVYFHRDRFGESRVAARSS
jgi:hypothetical protein